jgi:iron complex transport system substrate-binding protein
MFTVLGSGARGSGIETGFGPAGAARNNEKRIVTDEVGRVVTIPADVRRIVSLAPNLTETIYALGIEDRLVGDTDDSDIPGAATAKPHVGASLSPNLESIVALHPDLVFATTAINRRQTVDALERIGIPVYTSDPHTVRGTLDSIEHMAELAGAGASGKELIGRLRTRLDALQMRLADLPLVHVLFVVREAPLVTIGQNTFIADALRWAGAESVVLSKQNWPQISFEEVVRLGPESIVFTSHAGTATVELERLRSQATWKDLGAVEMGRVVVLSDEISRPSPGLVDAIEQLARQLHPEAFAAKDKMDNPVLHRLAFEEVPMQECTRCAR